tara:strand:+ start:9084 stop:9473 length:390 start_codon:yes stop_codon:yes gene_type:complete
MAVTTSQIRDLLNRPRGLNDGTVTEYITIRTAQVNKQVRSTLLYGLSTDSQISDTLKESAIKMMVCVDCLRVMIDTIPSYVPENEQRQQDIRFSTQLRSFEKQAQSLLDQISEAAGSAFFVDSTSTKQS